MNSYLMGVAWRPAFCGVRCWAGCRVNNRPLSRRDLPCIRATFCMVALACVLAVSIIGATWLRYDVRVAEDFVQGSCQVLSKRQIRSGGYGYDDDTYDVQPEAGRGRKLGQRVSRGRALRTRSRGGPTYRAEISVALTPNAQLDHTNTHPPYHATVCYPGCQTSTSGSKTWWLDQYTVGSNYTCWYDIPSPTDVEFDNSMSPWPIVVMVIILAFACPFSNFAHFAHRNMAGPSYTTSAAPPPAAPAYLSTAPVAPPAATSYSQQPGMPAVAVEPPAFQDYQYGKEAGVPYNYEGGALPPAYNTGTGGS